MAGGGAYATGHIQHLYSLVVEETEGVSDIEELLQAWLLELIYPLVEHAGDERKRLGRSRRTWETTT